MQIVIDIFCLNIFSSIRDIQKYFKFTVVENVPENKGTHSWIFYLQFM